MQEKNEEQVGQLLNEIAARTSSWQQLAMLEGMVEALPRGEARPGYLVLAQSPASLGTLAQSSEAPDAVSLLG